jgi:hypothetical protein
MSDDGPGARAHPAVPAAVTATTVIHRTPHAYSSHACVARLREGEWVVAFCQSIARASFLHPPSDPRFYNLLTRSSDLGRTWSEPRVVPGFDWYGVETPGIAQLSTGEVLLNQWRYRWYPLEVARKLWAEGQEVFVTRDGHHDEHNGQWLRFWFPASAEEDWARHPFPYARVDDGSYVHVSEDGGRTWERTMRLEVGPYRGAFSPSGAVELDDGDVLLALGSSDHDPLAACFVVRSSDRGRTWGPPVEVARTPGLRFSEPALVALGGGRVLLFAREEVTGHAHLSESSDGGRTWSPPEPLPFWGYPVHGTRLEDGRVVILWGRRREPYGIRAAVSEDGGRTWGPELVVRDDLPTPNLGYPSVIEYAPGKLFTAYYGEDAEGVTCIQGTYFEV